MVKFVPKLLIKYDIDTLYFFCPGNWSEAFDLNTIVSRLFTPSAKMEQLKRPLKHIAGNCELWDEAIDQINDCFPNLEEVLFVSYDITHYRPRKRLIGFEDAGYPYDSEWYDEVGAYAYLYEQGKGRPGSTGLKW